MDNLSEKLGAILREEIKIHESYQALLQQEKENYSKFKSLEVEQLAKQRAELHEKIVTLAAARQEIIAKSTGAKDRPLREVIRSFFPKTAQSELMALTKKLKAVVEKERQSAFELSQMSQFGLRIVQGSLAIFRSAGQSIARAYTRTGIVRESYQPAPTAKKRA